MDETLTNARKQLFNVGAAYARIDSACDLIDQAIATLKIESRAGLPIGHTLKSIEDALNRAKIARDNTWNFLKRMP